MSVLSVAQWRQTEPLNRPSGTGSDLDAVKSGGWLDTAGSSVNTTVDAVPFVQEQRIANAYRPVVQALAQAQNKSAAFAYFSPEKAAMALLPWTSNDPTDYDAVWRDMDRLARAGKLPDALKPVYAQGRDGFESDTLQRHGAAARDRIIAATGPASARLAGGLLGGFADPTMTGLAIATGGASRGLSVGKSILVEGLTNAGMVAAELPQTIAARERLGEHVSVGDAAGEVAMGFAFGAGVGTLTRGAGAAFRAGARTLGEADSANPWALAKAFARAVPQELRTPDQAAALAVIGRDEDVMGRNPFVPGMAGENAHAGRMNAAQRAVASAIEGDGMAAFARSVAQAESGGRADARSATSSAAGLFGFTDGTWIRTYRREFPNSPLPDAAVLQLRGDTTVQDRLFARLTRDNKAVLDRQGLPADGGNLYVMHHLGAGDGPKVLHADPATPLDQLLSPKVIEANPQMRGMTAGEFVAWARRRVGASADTVVAAGSDDAVAAIGREIAALDAERMAIDAQGSAGDATAADLYQPGAAPEDANVAAPAPTQRELDSGARAADPATMRDYEALKMRRALDRDLLERLGAERTNLPQAQALRDQISTILDKVNGVEARLTKTQAARLADARAALDQFLSSDTPYMQLVRQRLQTNDFKMRDLAPKVSEAYRRGADMMPPRQLEPLAERAPAPTLRRELFASEEERHAAQAQLNAEARGVAPAAAEDGGAAAVTRDRSSARGAAPAVAAAQPDGNAAPMVAEPAAVAPMPEAVAQRFADPAAADAVAQGASMTHDVQALQDAGRFAGVAFDTGEVETAAQALARLDDDDAALAALRGCL